MRQQGKTLKVDVNKNFVFKNLLTTPSNVLLSHLKQTFPSINWILTKSGGDGIESRLPFKIFSALPKIPKLILYNQGHANLGAINDVSAVDLPDHLLYWQSIWKKPRRGRDKLNPRKSITNLNPLKKGSLSSLRRGSVTPSIRNEPLAGTGGLMGLPNLGASLAGEQAASASPLTHRGGHEYKSEAGPDPRADGHSRGYSKEKFNFIEEFFICLACIFDWAAAVYCCSRQVAPPSQTAKDIQQSFSTHINLYFFAYLLEHKNMC